MSKEIYLTKGYKAVVDDEDYNDLEAKGQLYSWYAVVTAKHIYAARSATIDGRKQVIYLHRQLLDAPRGMTVDHEDKDGLNNTRSNLRTATYSENGANSVDRQSCTGYRGVSRNGDGWAARIANTKGSNQYLGTYSTPELAALEYNKAAVAKYGEFAALNKVES